MKMNELRRLHPIAALINFIKTVRELIIPLALFFLFGRGGYQSFIWTKSAVFIVTLVGTLVGGFLSWYRFTYRIEKGELRIEHGVFVRKKRYIPQERIQTIHISSGIIQRLFGLVKLQIETAGGGNEAEAVLTAITKEEADRVKAALLEDRIAFAQKTDHTASCYEATNKELFIAASTSGSIGVVLSAFGAFFSQFDELIPYEAVFKKLQQFAHFNVIIIFVMLAFGIAFAWLISILMMMAKYGRFTVVKNGNDLTISRGLLEKRQFNIPLARIQAIRISQNPIRQLLGYTAVYVESAGSTSEKESNYSTVLFPLVKMAHLNELLQTFVLDYSVPPCFEPLPRKALGRYLLRTVFPIAIVVFPACYFFRPWGYAALPLLAVFALLGYARFRDAGWYIANNHLALRYRLLTKVTVLLKKNRIQALQCRQSVFQRRKQLTTVQISIQSGLHSKHFKIIDAGENSIHVMECWYRQR